MRIFGRRDSSSFIRLETLNCRIQEPGESILRYAEDVLHLCQKVNPNMKNEEKLYYLKTGLDKYVSLVVLMLPCSTTLEFLKLCRRIDQHLKDHDDRRRLRRGQMRPRVIGNQINDDFGSYRNVSNITEAPRPIEQRIPYRPSDQHTYRPVVQRTSRPFRTVDQRAPRPVNIPYNLPSQNRVNEREMYRQEDRTFRNTRPAERSIDPRTYRTEDNRPICLYCNKPGHISKYCKNKQQVVRTIHASTQAPGPFNFQQQRTPVAGQINNQPLRTINDHYYYPTQRIYADVVGNLQPDQY